MKKNLFLHTLKKINSPSKLINIKDTYKRFKSNNKINNNCQISSIYNNPLSSFLSLDLKIKKKCNSTFILQKYLKHSSSSMNHIKKPITIHNNFTSNSKLNNNNILNKVNILKDILTNSLKVNKPKRISPNYNIQRSLLNKYSEGNNNKNKNKNMFISSSAFNIRNKNNSKNIFNKICEKRQNNFWDVNPNDFSKISNDGNEEGYFINSEISDSLDTNGNAKLYDEIYGFHDNSNKNYYPVNPKENIEIPDLIKKEEKYKNDKKNNLEIPFVNKDALKNKKINDSLDKKGNKINDYNSLNHNGNKEKENNKGNGNEKEEIIDTNNSFSILLFIDNKNENKENCNTNEIKNTIKDKLNMRDDLLKENKDYFFAKTSNFNNYKKDKYFNNIRDYITLDLNLIKNKALKDKKIKNKSKYFQGNLNSNYCLYKKKAIPNGYFVEKTNKHFSPYSTIINKENNFFNCKQKYKNYKEKKTIDINEIYNMYDNNNFKHTRKFSGNKLFNRTMKTTIHPANLFSIELL
jgi:hypothetical protein